MISIVLCMRLTYSSLVVLTLAAALSGCAEGPIPAPPPQQTMPAPRPMPAPVIRQEPEPTMVAGAWADAPLAPGNWVYRPNAQGSMAIYGVAGSSAHLVVACDRAQRTVSISRNGGTAGQLTLRATSGLKSYEARQSPVSPNYVEAVLAANDPQLDAVIYSRGRFMVSGAGGSDVIAPNWSEFARVVEDCR